MEELDLWRGIFRTPSYHSGRERILSDTVYTALSCLHGSLLRVHAYLGVYAMSFLLIVFGQRGKVEGNAHYPQYIC